MYDHDALWKGLLQAFFADFLELAVPEVAARLQTDRHRFLEKEAFTDPPEGRKALLDLVAEVQTRSGTEELVLVHVEIERSFGSDMDRRMWRYFFHLSLKYGMPIVPIVVFLRGGPGGLSRRKVEHRAAGFVVNRFSYWSLGLSQSAAQDWLQSPPLGVALASCARGDRLPKADQKFRCMEAILDSDVDDAQQQLLLSAVETYLALNEKQQLQYADQVRRSAREKEVRIMELTWAGKLRESGRREGVELGRREGVELGRREGVELGRREGVEIGQRDGRLATGRRMLLMILGQRFGEIPSALAERIDRLGDPAAVEKLGERALSAENLSEFEALLAR